MRDFLPRIAVTKAKISENNIRDGQLIVVVETGELYFDYGGQRIPLVQGGASSPSDDDEEDGFPNFVIVNTGTQVSGSLSGGGSSVGGTPGFPPISPEFTDSVDWIFQIINGNVELSGSLQGGGSAVGGTPGFPPVTVEFTDFADLIFQIVTGNAEASASLQGGGRAFDGVNVLAPLEIDTASAPEQFQIFT